MDENEAPKVALQKLGSPRRARLGLSVRLMRHQGLASAGLTSAAGAGLAGCGGW